MHPVMADSLKRLQKRLSEDKRCLGIFLSGSYAKQTADEYSDLDLVVVAERSGYAEFRNSLRRVCEEIMGAIPAWLPEDETPEAVNYAFLFETKDGIFLYDVCVIKDENLPNCPPYDKKHILFDRTGLLAGSVKERRPAGFNAKDLLRMVTCYWVYMYLNGKYLKRSDVYKLLYIQQTLFQNHLSVLHSFYPDKDWTWWAVNVRYLSKTKREEILVYFESATPKDIAAALKKEMDMFSQDAKEACLKYNLEYPANAEKAVRKHLAEFSVQLPVSSIQLED